MQFACVFLSVWCGASRIRDLRVQVAQLDEPQPKVQDPTDLTPINRVLFHHAINVSN